MDPKPNTQPEIVRAALAWAAMARKENWALYPNSVAMRLYLACCAIEPPPK